MALAQSTLSTRVLAAGAGLAVLALAGCSAGDSADAAADAAEPQTREAALEVITGAAEMNSEATGEAVVTVEDGTSVELTVSGLMPEVDYTSHLHDTACEADPPGGDHWLADPEAGMSESNEIHLHFTTDADGAASVTVDSDLVVDDRVKAIVVHVDEMGDMEGEGHDHMASDRVLCGDFD